MFSRLGPIGGPSGRQWLREFQAANAATELIHRRETSGEAAEEAPQGVSAAFRRAVPNAGRQIHADQK